MLAGIRKTAGLSQKQLGEITGWDKSFISRIEGTRGSVPDLETLARYAQACNAQAGVVIGVPTMGNELRVVDAVPLKVGVAPRKKKPFEAMRADDTELPQFVFDDRSKTIAD